MKKSLLALFGLTALLSGCTGPVEPDHSVSARGYVIDKGYVDCKFCYFDFSKEPSGCEVHGFSGAESFGRWSCEDTASIDLPITPQSEFTAKLNIDRVILPNEIPLEFDVLSNGNFVSHVSTNGGLVFVNVTKENVSDSGTTRLTLIFKNAALPSKYYPECQDNRKLGLALKSITAYGYSEKDLENSKKSKKRNK